MIWYFFSLICAFSIATCDAVTKKVSGEHDFLCIAWIRIAYAIPFLFLSLVFTPIPEIKTGFWYIIILAMPLEITAYLCYIKAISTTPLSLTIPFLAFTPVFLIGTSFLILGEKPALQGILGILFVTCGAYLLHVKSARKDLLAPLKNILKTKGSLLMCLTAFIYSITSSLGKMAIQKSGPVFFANCYFFILVLLLLPFVIYSTKGNVSHLFKRPLPFFIIGFLFALSLLTHFNAVAHIPVAYMISIKRLSLLFSVIYGKVLFKEKNFKERLFGCSVMVIGVLLITFS